MSKTINTPKYDEEKEIREFIKQAKKVIRKGKKAGKK